MWFPACKWGATQHICNLLSLTIQYLQSHLCRNNFCLQSHLCLTILCLQSHLSHNLKPLYFAIPFVSHNFTYRYTVILHTGILYLVEKSQRYVLLCCSTAVHCLIMKVGRSHEEVDIYIQGGFAAAGWRRPAAPCTPVIVEDVGKSSP